ncbi:MAG: TauD/TfdA family dioxygenase [Pseudomonadota bacterium]
MSTNQLDIRPLTTALGAEVFGVDLSEPLSNSAFDAVHQALLDHLVIFFRDQEISPERQVAFGRSFGALDIHPFAPALDGHPEVMAIVKEPEDKSGIRFGGIWHSDTTFYEEPVMGSILYAREVPSEGGDTLFANMYLAYETLSDGMKELLGGLQAVHSPARSYGKGGRLSEAGKAHRNISMKTRTDTGDDIYAEVIHPVIRTHPETGRKGLYVNPNFTVRFEGWTKEESAPLLDYLCAHAVQPEFTCRFRWRKGSIAFWDNRCTQHLALFDYQGQRREMHRVTVSGERPV